MGGALRDRRSIRLPDYDYGQAGAYFVTICAEGHERVFGEVVGDCVALSRAGAMVEGVWQALPDRFGQVDIDVFVVMPNHFHGIVLLWDQPNGERPERRLCDIVGAFKSITTHEYVLGVRHLGWPPFSKRLWQRNYYERVIRNEPELEAVRQYIVDNPAKWALDPENAGRG